MEMRRDLSVCFEAAQRCKQTRETHKEKKHSCSICVRNGFAWVCLTTTPRPFSLPPFPLPVEMKNHREEGSPTGLLQEHQCVYAPVFIFFVWSLLFLCQVEGAFPSRAASHLPTVKQSQDDGRALCINSFSVPVAVQLKIDHKYIT